MAKAKWAALKLHQLRLDLENYRLGPQKTERDAIRAMIEDQGTKLVRLAKDILEMHGTNPGEPIWVIPAPVRGRYIVEEGNRRVTTLKLMETPALADGTSVSKQFRRLAKIFAENPIRELDARVFDTRDDVLPWKRRRHMSAASGVGLERWNTFAKGRANRDIGLAAPRSLAVVELLQDESELWNDIREALDNRWTTVDRVLNTATFRDILGVHIDAKKSKVRFENGDQRAGRALLMRVLAKMASDDFEFSDVETVEDRDRFVAAFADGSVKGPPVDGVTDEEDAPTASQGGGDTAEATDNRTETEAPEKPTRRQQTDADRLTLAPDQGPRLLAVNGPRLGPLYRECRKIKVKGNENAAALLLRVFIELSSEALLQEKVAIPPSLKQKNITKWDDYKVKLSDKILAAAYYLDPANNAKEFQQARLATRTDDVGKYSIATLHGYFHNRHLLPDAASIKDTWDGWESYLREVHTALNPA